MSAPVLYLSHGAPPLADDATWTRELKDRSATLQRPEAVLMVSAHWEEAPTTIGATETVPLVYDFWGFPQRYYEVTYEAPGAPESEDAARRAAMTSTRRRLAGRAVANCANCRSVMGILPSNSHGA